MLLGLDGYLYSYRINDAKNAALVIFFNYEKKNQSITLFF